MKYYTKIALQHLAMGLIIPIAIIWKLQNGLTVSEAVMTESLVLLATALVDLPAGFIANAINNKRALIVGGLLHLVGMILLFLGGSLAVFIIAAIITGAAWAFVSGADEAYLHDDYIEDKTMYKKHFSTVTIVDEAFTILGMLLASAALVFNSSLRMLFLVSSLLLAVHLLYTVFALPRSKVQLPVTHSANIAGRFTWAIIKNKEVLSIVPLMIAFAFIYEAGRPLWQPHLQEIGINIAGFGALFALFKLASIGGSLLSRGRDFKLSDLVLVFTVMLGALLAFGLSFKVVSIVALCAYLFTENYFRVYMSTALNKAITNNRAAVLSFGSVLRNGVGALIIAGMGVVSSVSILLALSILVIIKIPAIAYTLRTYAAAK